MKLTNLFFDEIRYHLKHETAPEQTYKLRLGAKRKEMINHFFQRFRKRIKCTENLKNTLDNPFSG